MFGLDKSRAVSVLNSFKNDPLLVVFAFSFYIKSHVRLYKILCSLVFFLTSISFIRYKVTVMVLISFVFPSWITNEVLKANSKTYLDQVSEEVSLGQNPKVACDIFWDEPEETSHRPQSPDRYMCTWSRDLWRDQVHEGIASIECPEPTGWFRCILGERSSRWQVGASMNNRVAFQSIRKRSWTEKEKTYTKRLKKVVATNDVVVGFCFLRSLPKAN